VFGLGHYWSGSSRGQKMHNLIAGAFEGRMVRIPAAETFANEYVYGKDVGRAIDLAATVKMPEERVFNIGSGVVSTIEEVVETVRAVCPGLKCEIEGGGAGQPKPVPLSIERAKKHLGWEPRFTLRSGYEDYLAELKAARAAA
jgi:nucleoside-diphosphate-sugar epimerase